MRRRDFLGALGVGLVGVGAPRRLVGAARAWRDDVPVERWSWAMGQPVHLQLYAASEAEGYDAAQAALGELRRVEAALSLFDDASDLVELNRRAGRGPVAVGPDLAATLEANWFLHHDADEFRESPWPDLDLLGALERVDALGYSAIDFRVLNFRPTHDDFTLLLLRRLPEAAAGVAPAA